MKNTKSKIGTDNFSTHLRDVVRNIAATILEVFAMADLSIKTLEAAESQTTAVQQLKAEILPMLCEASESLRIGDLDDGERIINEITAKLSAV